MKTHEIARQLTPAMRLLDEQGQRVAITLYRLLAEAEPVGTDRLAEATGEPREDVERLLDGLPGVYRDDQRRVVGFWGLALDGMPHRMRVREREIRGWCAWDTLFIPELLGTEVLVESRCPSTHRPIGLTVDPAGVRDVSPPEAALSFLLPTESFDYDTIASFCHYVHFFASPDAAREWTSGHEGTFVLSVEDGYEIGKLTNLARFGAVLGTEQVKR